MILQLFIERGETQVSFKNCVPYITKIDGTTADDDEDLELVMLMYILLEYSSNYSETTGSLWFYSKDRAINFDADIANTNNFKSFEYKANLLGNTEADGANGILKNTTIAVPLNFWRFLEMSLINYKVALKLKWPSYCVLSALGANANNANSKNITFTIKDTKLYVPIITLSVKHNQKLSKFLSKGFERSVYWNEYKTKSENKNTTNEYRCFLKLNFVGVDRFFILV